MRTWSKYQLAVFDNVANGTGHTVVNAVAGSGKSTTIENAVDYIPAGCSTIFVAFNKPIADALAKRMAGKPVEVSTLHSYGLKCITRTLGRLAIDKYRVHDFAEQSYRSEVEALKFTIVNAESDDKVQLARERLDVIDDRCGLLVKTVSLAKGALALTPEAIDDVMYRFGIELPSPDDDEEYDEEVADADRAKFVQEVIALLRRCWSIEDGRIDFDDMIWLPVVRKLPQRKFDRVFVDETQDLSTAQIEMTLRACREAGRVMAVGDPRQCIPAGQMISTPRGPVPIEQIREGDEILAAKGGAMVPRRVVKKTQTIKEKAFEFDLGEYGRFQATAEHVLFAAIDDPMGSFVYLMYRPDLGFRIGVSRTVGKRGNSFIVRTAQEGGERLWVLEWHETYSAAAEREAFLSYEYGIPREPFKPRDGMWSGTVEATVRLFGRFGSNGSKLLSALGIDFDRPNFFAKASGSGRIAVNLRIGTKDGHVVEVESSVADQAACDRFNMETTGRGTRRLRRYFKSLREATMFAGEVAESLRGYVVEHLACTDANRRSLAVHAHSVNVGMVVPVVGDDGTIGSAKVLSRREVPAKECFDLEVDELGTFVVNGVVVHNCIYSFRGADERAFDNVRERLGAVELPLSICYRCSKAVVRRAQAIVPAIEAAPDAVEGEVVGVSREQMEMGARPGDFILSRTNAPLVGLCMKFLRAGRRANIQGRDVGASLVAFIKKSKAKNIDALRSYVENWSKKECARLAAKRRDTQEIEDREACLMALTDGADSVSDVIDNINELFADKSDGACIMLSTTHKAKGLERNRVWMLAGTYRPGTSSEESALMYVAQTRAKHTLFLVEGFEKKPRGGSSEGA